MLVKKFSNLVHNFIPYPSIALIIILTLRRALLHVTVTLNFIPETDLGSIKYIFKSSVDQRHIALSEALQATIKLKQRYIALKFSTLVIYIIVQNTRLWNVKTALWYNDFLYSKIWNALQYHILSQHHIIAILQNLNQ